MLKKHSQRVRGVHASHTDIPDFLDAIRSAERHDVHSVAYSACVIDVVGEGFCHRFVNCVVQVLWVAKLSELSTFRAGMRGKSGEDRLFASWCNGLWPVRGWSCCLWWTWSARRPRALWAVTLTARRIRCLLASVETCFTLRFVAVCCTCRFVGPNTKIAWFFLSRSQKNP